MLWIVDGGMLTLPVIARIEDWHDGEFIDITTGDESGEWSKSPTRYVARGTCHISGGECDQCGAYVRDDAVTYWMPTGEGMRTVETHAVRFCPACGRRVVEVDE